MEITVTLKPPLRDGKSTPVLRFTDADLSTGPGHLAVIGRLRVDYGTEQRAQYGWPLAEVRSWTTSIEVPNTKSLGQEPDLPPRQPSERPRAIRVGEPGYHSRGQGTLPDR